MGKEVVVQLPKLGESIVSATVVSWHKKEGDFVKTDESLLEVTTDKVNSEVPSPINGKIIKIYAQEGQEIQVGDKLALIESTAKKEDETVEVTQTIIETEKIKVTSHSDFLSPAVVNLLREANIPLEEVDKIPRLSESGRLTKKDVEAFIESKKQKLIEKLDDHERIKMDVMRKSIAENMVKSFYAAPHASLMTQVDVTDVLNLIKENKESFLQKHGVKLTVTSFVAKAICSAIKEFPYLNSSLEEDTIIMKHYVNLGIAVHVDKGLQVPIIRHCQKMDIAQIAKSLTDLAQKARGKKLRAKDVMEGSITFTNFGMTGVMAGIPIIRYPEVAIIGMGAIEKKPLVMANDEIKVRSTAMLTLTFDHRVLDGIYGCGFLNKVKTDLENAKLD